MLQESAAPKDEAAHITHIAACTLVTLVSY
jgi:hypothetical protein